MALSKYKLNSCIICSEYPSDLNELFEKLAGFDELNSLIRSGVLFKTIDELDSAKINLKEYGLLVEDEISTMADLIRQFAQTEEIKHWVICKNLPIANSFLEVATKNPLVVGLDFRLEALPVTETQKFYEALKSKWSDTIVIGITFYEQNNDLSFIKLKNLMRSKGDSVYEKGIIIQALPNIIRDKFAISKLRGEIKTVKAENLKLIDELDSILPKESGKSYLVGKSIPMRILYKDLLKIKSVDDVRVLILGEAGTGKELIAKAIHEDSPRGRSSAFPFFPVNCGEISDDTNSAISKLFGHKKGSYTGADNDKKGIFELANNGTVFLDEVGELPGDAQSKLLRYLVDSKFTRLGEDDYLRSSNVRIICATNADLEALKKDGKFREDFYSRIAERIIKVPSLQERKDDINDLAAFFIQDKEILKKKFGNDSMKFQFAENALNILQENTFSTNVRQLRHVIVNAMIESKYYNEIQAGKLQIKAEHVKEGLLKAGVQSSTINIKNTIYEDVDCYEVETFLDKIEKIVIENFATKYKVAQPEFLEKFPSTKTGKTNMNRVSFTNDELNPRKACIEKLLNNNPNRWTSARTKCQFIRNAKTTSSKT